MTKRHPQVMDASEGSQESFPWGTLRWLYNARLSAGAMQTVGTCQILPGCRNPLHFHPNCEEILYLVAGRGRHRYDDDRIDLVAGSAIRIPAGVRHNLENTGSEPLECLIVFSTGNRETVFLE